MSLLAKKIFNTNDWHFFKGADNYNQLPDWKNTEFAFIGSSNVGKSSIINALLGKKIAIVSNTPGRTRQINFFHNNKYSNILSIVDMPGYGFAKANQKNIQIWNINIVNYFSKRHNLKKTFLLIDPTKGLKESDLDIINGFNDLGICFQIIFTKVDKISQANLKKAKEDLLINSKKWPALHPEIILSSSNKNIGIREIQEEICKNISF